MCAIRALWHMKFNNAVYWFVEPMIPLPGLPARTLMYFDCVELKIWCAADTDKEIEK